MATATRKPTKAQIKAYLKGHIANSEKWALLTLKVVYNNQTLDEKKSEFTSHDNGVGFNSTDSKFFTQLAKKANKGYSLSPKQMACVFKKMPKYWAQMQAAWESTGVEKMHQRILDWYSENS